MTLSHQVRPTSLKEFLGQSHLLGDEKVLSQLIKSKRLTSLIFWGPPGSGKTTLANIVANEFEADFHSLSATSSGKKDLLEIINKAKTNQEQDIRTIIFIDEIHRWTKSQQDALLPHVESGLITLIGATTENPSFEIIGPLLSRTKLFVFKPLSHEDITQIIKNALTNKKLGIAKYKKTIDDKAMGLLITLSGGDARVALNALEVAIYSYPQKEITVGLIQNIFQTKSAGLYDKQADFHFHLISAFIKSLRGSDVNASLFYMFKMLESGEDPKFIARRMIIFSSEDIGLADRGALIQANAAFEAVTKIGMPEAKLILAHIVIYLALSKKSRAVANAVDKSVKAVYQYPHEQVPLHLRNPSTKLNKQMGYGKEYSWKDNKVGPTEDLPFLPESIKDLKLYTKD